MKLKRMLELENVDIEQIAMLTFNSRNNFDFADKRVFSFHCQSWTKFFHRKEKKFKSWKKRDLQGAGKFMRIAIGGSPRTYKFIDRKINFVSQTKTQKTVPKQKEKSLGSKERKFMMMRGRTNGSVEFHRERERKDSTVEEED